MTYTHMRTPTSRFEMAYSSSEEDDEFRISLSLPSEVLPYQFEPLRPQNAADVTPQPFHHKIDRIGNNKWCLCSFCLEMATATECVCCLEIKQVATKLEGFDDTLRQTASYPGCITKHPGFEAVCLNVYTLETAYYAYKQQYGKLHTNIHERYRYIAIRQLVCWCWGFVGKSVRVPLPACAVAKIRDTFPDGGRVGFKLPQLD